MRERNLNIIYVYHQIYQVTLIGSSILIASLALYTETTLLSKQLHLHINLYTSNILFCTLLIPGGKDLLGGEGVYWNVTSFNEFHTSEERGRR